MGDNLDYCWWKCIDLDHKVTPLSWVRTKKGNFVCMNYTVSEKSSSLSKIQ